MGASTGASRAAVESTVATALCRAGVQLTMCWATVMPEQPVETGNGSSSVIKAHAHSFAEELATVEAEPGSLASRPRSAVATALTSVSTVPEQACPRLMPCCERTPAMVRVAISKPVIEVLGWFQMLAMEFIRNAPCTEKGSECWPGFNFDWVADCWARGRPQFHKC